MEKTGDFLETVFSDVKTWTGVSQAMRRRVCSLFLSVAVLAVACGCVSGGGNVSSEGGLGPSIVPPEAAGGLVASPVEGVATCGQYQGASVGLSEYVDLHNESDRVYTVRSVELVESENLALNAAYTKPWGESVALNDVSFPYDDANIYPEYWNDPFESETREALALLRPLGDESLVPARAETELDLVVKPVDLSQPGVMKLARIVVRDEGSGALYSVMLRSRRVVGVNERPCDSIDFTSDEWPLPDLAQS